MPVMKKNTKRKWLLVAIGILLFFVVGKACYNSHSDTDKEDIALDQEVELHFDGCPRIGETYLFAVRTRQVQTKRLYQGKESKSSDTRQTNEAFAYGELIFQSLTPLVVHFKVDILERTADDKVFDYSPLKGMTAIIQTSSENMSERPLVKDEIAVSFVPVSDAPEEIRELQSGACRLIASMFSILLHRPEDYLGTTRTAKPGDKWNASTKPVSDALKAEGLEVSENDFKSTAIYRNRLKVESNIPAHNILLQIESVDIPGYDYKLELHYDFPDDGDDVPLHIDIGEITVTGRENPDDSSSKTIQAVTNQSEISMVRKSVLNPPLFPFMNKPVMPQKKENEDVPDSQALEVSHE